MNKSMIRYVIGWVLNVSGVFMLLPIIVAVIYQESAGLAFMQTMVVCLAGGISLTRKRPKNHNFYAKDGFVSVSLSWLVLSIVGSLPFLFSGEIPHLADAFFEIVSGYTTTGSSILTDIDSLSKCIVFWRSFTHWVGGMGVLVFILAIIPATGGSNMHLMRAESPGPNVGKLVPRLRSTATILYAIYAAMTLVMIFLLLVGGMPLFDAITISLGTAGTGGFSPSNAGVTAYPSYYLQNVITLFMILFGVNFNVYYLLMIRKVKDAFACEEAKWYFIIIGITIIMVAGNLYGSGVFGLVDAFHHGAFQVATIITTTGYASANFDLWPQLSRTVLIILMFIGACAGSTAGGIKVSRIVMLVKSAGKEVMHLLHPRTIKVLKFEGRRIEKDTMHSMTMFFFVYWIVFAIASLIISLDNFDMTTNFTAVATTINNVGPGLGLIGPMGNFSMFSDLSKYTLAFTMLFGRLEIFPMLLLFMPSTWRK